MATMKDVAKLAGVSVGSVSKYLNNIEVKPKTSVLIEKAIQELKYEPNIYAKGLKMNRTNTIALIVPTVWHPFFGELAFFVEKSLRAHDMKLILCNTEENIKNEIEYISMARQHRMDGIITVSYSDVDKYISSSLPVISIDRFFSEDITYVSSDNFKGGWIAAEELIKAGCKQLAYIGSGSVIDNATRDRKRGFIQYCQENQIPFQVCEQFGKKEEFDFVLNEFLDENIRRKRNIDGIFNVTDTLAFDTIRKLEGMEIQIPDDIQIVGFDGSKSSAKDTIEISTIRQPVDMIAQSAVNALVDVINKKDIPKKITLPVSFVKGYTTKKV